MKIDKWMRYQIKNEDLFIAKICPSTNITQTSIHLSKCELLSVYCNKKRKRASDLIHWGRVTHICVGNLTIIGSDNGLSPGRRQAITWTNVGILLIRPIGTNFSEMLIEIHTFSFKKIHLKMVAILSRPQCVNVMKLLGIMLLNDS